MTKHIPLDSTSMSQGSSYLHIPMNVLCPIALNVDIFRIFVIIIIVLKLIPVDERSYYSSFRNLNNALLILYSSSWGIFLFLVNHLL